MTTNNTSHATVMVVTGANDNYKHHLMISGATTKVHLFLNDIKVFSLLNGILDAVASLWGCKSSELVLCGNSKAPTRGLTVCGPAYNLKILVCDASSVSVQKENTILSYFISTDEFDSNNFSKFLKLCDED